MARVLVAYGTRHGKAAQLARRVADRLSEAGHDVAAVDLRSRRKVTPSAYDAVVVGASVHAGGFEHEVKRWVRDRRRDLAARPNAFFTVSLTSSDHDCEHDVLMQGIIDRFTRSTGWHPDDVDRFAGALSYSKYNAVVRWMMKRIVRREGHPEYTDTSHDYDFTDYAQVDAFARRFAHRIAAACRRNSA